MSDRPEPVHSSSDAAQIAAGIAVFVGSMALAALLKPLMPWAGRRARQPGQPAPSSDQDYPPTQEDSLDDAER